jgi:hypothetical protein
VALANVSADAGFRSYGTPLGRASSLRTLQKLNMGANFYLMRFNRSTVICLNIDFDLFAASDLNCYIMRGREGELPVFLFCNSINDREKLEQPAPAGQHVTVVGPEHIQLVQFNREKLEQPALAAKHTQER